MQRECFKMKGWFRLFQGTEKSMFLSIDDASIDRRDSFEFHFSSRAFLSGHVFAVHSTIIERMNCSVLTNLYRKGQGAKKKWGELFFLLQKISSIFFFACWNIVSDILISVLLSSVTKRMLDPSLKSLAMDINVFKGAFLAYLPFADFEEKENSKRTNL